MVGSRKIGIERYPICTGSEPNLRPLPKQAEADFDRYARSEPDVVEWICRYPAGWYEKWGMFGMPEHPSVSGTFDSALPPELPPQPQPVPIPASVSAPSVPQETFLDAAVKRLNGLIASAADSISRYRAEIITGAAALIGASMVAYAVQRLVRARPAEKEKAQAEVKAEVKAEAKAEAKAEPMAEPLPLPPPVDPAEVRYAQLVLRIEGQLREHRELTAVLKAEADDGSGSDHAIEVAQRRMRIAALIANHTLNVPNVFDIIDERVVEAAFKAEGVAGIPLPQVSLAHDSHADPLREELHTAARAWWEELRPLKEPDPRDYAARDRINKARQHAAVVVMAEALQPGMERFLDGDGTISRKGVQEIFRRHGITEFAACDLPVLELGTMAEEQRGVVNLWFQRIRTAMLERVEHVHRQLRQLPGLELLPASRLGNLASDIVTHSLGADTIGANWARTTMPAEGVVAEAFARNGIDPKLASQLSIDALHADEEKGLREEYENLYRELQRRYGDSPEIASRAQELLLVWHSMEEPDQLRAIERSFGRGHLPGDGMSITEQLLEAIDLKGLDRSARLPELPFLPPQEGASFDRERFRIALDNGLVIDAVAFGELTNLDPVSAAEFVKRNRQSFLQYGEIFERLEVDQRAMGFEWFVAAKMAERAKAQGWWHGAKGRSEERRRGRAERMDEPTVKILKGK